MFVVPLLCCFRLLLTERLDLRRRIFAARRLSRLRNAARQVRMAYAELFSAPIRTEPPLIRREGGVQRIVRARRAQGLPRHISHRFHHAQRRFGTRPQRLRTVRPVGRLGQPVCR